MEIKQLPDKHKLLITNHGYQALYHDLVVIAGYSPMIGYFMSTTYEGDSKELNKYLSQADGYMKLTETQIERMFMEI